MESEECTVDSDVYYKSECVFFQESNLNSSHSQLEKNTDAELKSQHGIQGSFRPPCYLVQGSGSGEPEEAGRGVPNSGQRTVQSVSLCYCQFHERIEIC